MMIIRPYHSFRNLHRGVTLIEVIGTLSILLAIGVSTATIMSAVTKVGRRGNASVQQRDAIKRFATQLRTDVHQANEFESSAEGWPLQLRGSDFEVRYELHTEQGSLRRTRLESDQVTSVESFEFGKERQITLQTSENQVTVVIDTESAAYPFIVEAIYGKPDSERPDSGRAEQ